MAAGQVSVLVANATTVTGAAGRVTSTLSQRGYHTLPPVNATTHATTTSVYYVSGYSQPALSIASVLSLASSDVSVMTSNPPVSTLDGTDVLVVVGPGLAARQSGSKGS